MPDSKPQWTPGPWIAERANVGDQHPLFVRCNLDSAFRPPCDADAHLIAAAPDLYTALEQALNFVTMTRLRDFSGLTHDELVEAQWNVAEAAREHETRMRAALLKANPQPTQEDKPNAA
jgi:hypothetical protein